MIKRYAAILFILSLFLTNGCYFYADKKSGGGNIHVFEGDSKIPLEGVLIEIGKVYWGNYVKGKPLSEKWQPYKKITTDSKGMAFHPPRHKWRFGFFGFSWGDPIFGRLYRFSKPGYKSQQYVAMILEDHEIYAYLVKKDSDERTSTTGFENTMGWSTFMSFTSGTAIFFTIPILFVTSPIWLPIALLS